MRYTATREQVFNFLDENPGKSFNAYEIADKLTMNAVTVYRVLEFLKEN